MSLQNNRFNIGCLALVMIVIGLLHIIPSLIALKDGTTISFGRGRGGTRIQVNPRYTMVFGGVFLGFGVAGAYKAWKDRDKYPF